MKNKLIFWTVAALFLSLLLTACAEETAGPPVSSLSVELSEFKFTPAKMSVYANQEITIQLSNNGSLPHDFTILKPGAVAATPFDPQKQKEDILYNFSIDPQAAVTQKFTLPTPGEYNVICIVPGHVESGMTAKITAVNP
ncbi:MAG: cupredoxin domain-containing protein [Chloroflexota bacterium]